MEQKNRAGQGRPQNNRGGQPRPKLQATTSASRSASRGEAIRAQKRTQNDAERIVNQYLTAENFKVDYVAIADAGTLEPVQSWDGERPLVALTAAYLNEVRLIDNMLI